MTLMHEIDAAGEMIADGAAVEFRVNEQHADFFIRNRVQLIAEVSVMPRRKCGATYNGHTCTLKVGHGGSVHSELVRIPDERNTLSYSWATGMGEPGPDGGA